VVIDIEAPEHTDHADQLLLALREIPGTIRARILY
jgi:hypothetical protein